MCDVSLGFHFPLGQSSLFPGLSPTSEPCAHISYPDLIYAAGQNFPCSPSAVAPMPLQILALPRGLSSRALAWVGTMSFLLSFCGMLEHRGNDLESAIGMFQTQVWIFFNIKSMVKWNVQSLMRGQSHREVTNRAVGTCLHPRVCGWDWGESIYSYPLWDRSTGQTWLWNTWDVASVRRDVLQTKKISKT